MSCQILNGQEMAHKCLLQLKEKLKLASLKKARPPGLSTILVGHDPASKIYVKNKHKKALLVGIHTTHHELPPSISEAGLLSLITDLNQDQKVDGILVQLPLPPHIDPKKIIEAIDPKKDVDGFHPHNLGYLFSNNPKVIPCTPKGCLRILEEAKIDLFGKRAVVVGRSIVVGNPMAQLLVRKHATTTIAHRYTQDLALVTKDADLIVVAVGKPNLITKDHVKKGAIIIDVGINRKDDNTICGDVDFKEVAKVASAITPVPGGVGPMTIAMLMENTMELWQRHLSNTKE